MTVFTVDWRMFKYPGRLGHSHTWQVPGLGLRQQVRGMMPAAAETADPPAMIQDPHAGQVRILESECDPFSSLIRCKSGQSSLDS